MGLIASEAGSSDFELAPTGTHRAVCFGVVDLGTQEGSFGPKHQVVISWELTDAKMSDTRPFAVSKFYTLSLSEKANLRADLQNWRGKAFSIEELEGFDISKLLGAPALVTVVHKEKKTGGQSAVVSGVSSLPKGMDKPTPFNPVYVFDLDEPSAVIDIEKLPEWLQNKIRQSPEWLALTGGSSQPSTAYGMPSAEKSVAEDEGLPF